MPRVMMVVKGMMVVPMVVPVMMTAAVVVETVAMMDVVVSTLGRWRWWPVNVWDEGRTIAESKEGGRC